MTAIEVLKAARELLSQPVARCSGSFHWPLFVVSLLDQVPSVDVRPALDVWHDPRWRTHAEVLALLDAAIARLA